MGIGCLGVTVVWKVSSMHHEMFSLDYDKSSGESASVLRQAPSNQRMTTIGLKDALTVEIVHHKHIRGHGRPER